MKSIKMLSIAVVLFGMTVVGSAQTFQDVGEAWNRASEFLSSGDLDGVIAELEKCVELSNKVGTDEAEEIGMKAEINLPGYYYQRATKILATRDFPATLQAIEATITAAEKYGNPDIKEKAEKTIPQIYMAMGTADFQAKRFEDAIKNFDQVVARDPGNAAAYFVRGACFQQLNDEPQMEENYNLAIEKGDARGKKQLSTYHYNAGIAAQRAQKWDDAIASYLKAIEVDSEYADAYYSLAVCYDNRKSWDNVITNAEKALELGHSRTDGINFYLGNEYTNKKDNAKA
jgi:tetratricopeptide (TPR) repeat protein